MANKLTESGLKARRAYQRKNYAKRKKEGTLPPDRYSVDARREYNRQYREGKRGSEIMIDYFNRKGEALEE